MATVCTLVCEGRRELVQATAARRGPKSFATRRTQQYYEPPLPLLLPHFSRARVRFSIRQHRGSLLHFRRGAASRTSVFQSPRRLFTTLVVGFPPVPLWLSHLSAGPLPPPPLPPLFTWSTFPHEPPRSRTSLFLLSLVLRLSASTRGRPRCRAAASPGRPLEHRAHILLDLLPLVAATFYLPSLG